MVALLFFGPLRDVAKASLREIDLPASVTTVAQLIDWLSEHDPVLADMLTGPSLQVAVDQRIVPKDSLITNESEIAFLPPMSGG
jgi:sulfur-carrier protein